MVWSLAFGCAALAEVFRPSQAAKDVAASMPMNIPVSQSPFYGHHEARPGRSLKGDPFLSALFCKLQAQREV